MPAYRVFPVRGHSAPVLPIPRDDFVPADQVFRSQGPPRRLPVLGLRPRGLAAPLGPLPIPVSFTPAVVPRRAGPPRRLFLEGYALRVPRVNPPRVVTPIPEPPDEPFNEPAAGKPLVHQVVRPPAEVPGMTDKRDPAWEAQLRRFTQKVGAVVNSLVAQGYIVELAPGGRWEIRARTPSLSSHRVPEVTDDETVSGVYRGAIWVETTTLTGYLCVDATEGAAVWKQITN